MCPRTERTAPVPWHSGHAPARPRRPLPAQTRQVSRRVTVIVRCVPLKASSNDTCISDGDRRRAPGAGSARRRSVSTSANRSPNVAE